MKLNITLELKYRLKCIDEYENKDIKCKSIQDHWIGLGSSSNQQVFQHDLLMSPVCVTKLKNN